MNKFYTMKMRWIFPAVLLAVVALTLVACAPAGPTATVVNVTLSEYKIVLDKTSIPAGPVTFELKNDGTLAHAFLLEPVGAKNEPFERDGKKSQTGDIAAGETGTLEWTIDAAGEYQLTCYTPGHFEQGMTTTFTVTAP
jgi:uncharacterized cupredoxin-like copper-binding protein